MLENQRKQLSELAEQYGKEKEEISDGIRVLKEKSEELRNKFAGLTKLYNDKQKKLSDYKKESENILFDIRSKEQRKKLLIDLENNMEGFAKSVREIIKASSGGRISGIRGTVAQLINVKQEYATAIETALGLSLIHI